MRASHYFISISLHFYYRILQIETKYKTMHKTYDDVLKILYTLIHRIRNEYEFCEIENNRISWHELTQNIKIYQ